jgi:hypothetical protein
MSPLAGEPVVVTVPAPPPVQPPPPRISWAFAVSDIATKADEINRIFFIGMFQRKRDQW